MKIYTKTGDEGETGLFDGQRVGKDHLRMETIGAVDEVSSWLGMVAAAAGCPAEIGALMLRIQHQLFDVGADLATPPAPPAAGGVTKNEGKIVRIGGGAIAFLEGEIDSATGKVAPLRKFVLPGGCEVAARLHVARTVCRRAERCLVRLRREEEVGREVLIYLNRLSDLLFTLARLANAVANVKDVEWEKQIGE